jgi:hypothetical protein
MMNLLSSVRVLISISLFVMSSLVSALCHSELTAPSLDAGGYGICDDTTAFPTSDVLTGVGG